MHQEIKDKINLKIIKIINGEDIVCHLPENKKQLPDDSALLRLQRPLQVKYVPQITPTGFKDYIALIRWVNFTPDNIITIPKDKIMVVSRAAKELANYYDVILHKLKNSKIKTAYSQDQINKILEIADELDSQLKREEEEAILYDEFDPNKTIH